MGLLLSTYLYIYFQCCSTSKTPNYGTIRASKVEYFPEAAACAVCDKYHVNRTRSDFNNYSANYFHIIKENKTT